MQTLKTISKTIVNIALRNFISFCDKMARSDRDENSSMHAKPWWDERKQQTQTANSKHPAAQPQFS